jgi:tight adherence protein C
MPGFVSIIIFVAIVLVVMALTYAFSGGSVPIAERLGHLWRLPGQERPALKESRQKKVVDFVLVGAERILPSGSDQTSETSQRLIRAGFRRPEAGAVLNAARVVLIVALLALIYLTGLYKSNPLLLSLTMIVAGFILPDMWLTRRVKSRQQLLRLALPDALDLLVICMEAGLGLDQALMYVSQELRIAHRALCEEFDLVNAEVHVGKTRLEALRALAARTGVDDLQALVATLIQTDRFGTSVAHSLRIHSDDLRTKRRQRAEEMAAKTTVKMAVPLVFFIFPALFVVILGPAVITMIHALTQIH